MIAMMPVWRWENGWPPSNIANLVTFPATGACRHLTGTTLDVNGASYVL